MSRVLERKNSTVHAGMWKAHRSGITLTPPPIRHSTISTPLQQQALKQLRRSSTEKQTVGLDASVSTNYTHHSGRHSHSLPRTGSARRRAFINHNRQLLSNGRGDVSSLLNTAVYSSNGSVLSINVANAIQSSGSLRAHTMSGKPSSTSLLSFPGIKEANPLLQSKPSSQYIMSESIGSVPAFIADESLPSYSMNGYRSSSFGSIRQANNILESSLSSSLMLVPKSSTQVNVDDGDGATTFTSIQSKHQRNSSVEHLDLATAERQHRRIKAQPMKLQNNELNSIVDHSEGIVDEGTMHMDVNPYDSTSEQKWLDMQTGKISTNSILLDHSLRSSKTSLQSLDLAQLDAVNSSLSLPSNLDLFADSSKSIPSIRKVDAMNHYSSNSVLETIRSEEMEKFPLQYANNIQSNFNLQAMRGKSIMSFTTSRSSLDDSFLTTNSSNLWMKPGIAFDDSDLRSCKSDDTSVYATSDHQSLKTASTFPHGHNDDDLSWDGGVNENEETKFDPWNLLVDEYEEYGYGLRGLPFQILGTSVDDEECQPHVLSPPLMESLFQFLPFAISEENFWIKYSLLRDGASFFSLLQNVRGSKSTLIAIETVDGEVFGSFTNAAWRKSPSFFGSGEAFLWRMRNDRKTVCTSILDQARVESEIEVFPWTGSNYMIQFCDDKRIAIGSGTALATNGGFGLCIDDQVLHGTSSYCSTFNNPPLSKEHQDGSPFEIVNLEVWTLTPSMSVEEAEKIEFGRLFLELHRQKD